MKKSLLLGLGILAGTAAFAQTMEEPLLLPYFYATQMTPDGKVIGSQVGNASLYYPLTGETYFFEDVQLGLGRAISQKGITVGDYLDHAVIITGEDAITPPSLVGAWFCDLFAITPDATRLVGIINNPDETSETIFLPFYCDIDENGNVGDPNILPYPKLDFMHSEPQYITAFDISDDGKTIVGQVMDWFGRMDDPIVFKEDANGNWSYTLPSEPLFNPDHLEIPENPYVDEPDLPDYADFMDPESRAIWEEEYEDWIMSGADWNNFPDPFSLMTAEQEQAYWDAVDVVNQWAEEHRPEILAFERVYRQVLASSPLFMQNELAMKPDGTQFAVSAGAEDENGATGRVIYIFNTEDGSYKKIASKPSDVYPHQFLPNGIVVATSEKTTFPWTYLLYPETEEFVSVVDYFRETSPYLADWVDENLNKSGAVTFSADMSVIAGAVQSPMFNYTTDMEIATYLYATAESGVESTMAAPADETYRVYNLQGVNVLTTKDAAAVNNLPAGLYIVNGKKVLVK